MRVFQNISKVVAGPLCAAGLVVGGDELVDLGDGGLDLADEALRKFSAGNHQQRWSTVWMARPALPPSATDSDQRCWWFLADYYWNAELRRMRHRATRDGAC
jgi:hypothetical protein